MDLISSGGGHILVDNIEMKTGGESEVEITEIMVMPLYPQPGKPRLIHALGNGALLHGLPPGLYLLRHRTQSGEWVQRKIWLRY